MRLLSNYHIIVYSNKYGIKKFLDQIKIVTNNTQSLFEDILKLLIKKSIPGLLNRTTNNYSAIDKYHYKITRDSIGWNGESLISFKMIPKFHKDTSSDQRKIKKIKIPFLNPNSIMPSNTISNCQSGLNSIYVSNIPSSAINTIVNLIPSHKFRSDVLYSESLKSLENIGTDIVNQFLSSESQPDLSPFQNFPASSQYFNLVMQIKKFEDDLSALEKETQLFDSYLDMIKIINSIDSDNILQLLNLIATLSVKKWQDFSSESRTMFTNIFGEKFISDLLDNQVFNLLLSNDMYQYVILSSFFYSLLKILYLIFGYSKLYRTNSTENLSKLQNNIRFIGSVFPILSSLMGGTQNIPDYSDPANIYINTSVHDNICIPNYQGLDNITEFILKFNGYSNIVLRRKNLSNVLVTNINTKKNQRIKYLMMI